MLTHGSEERRYRPPVHSETPRGIVSLQLLPPFLVTPARRPREPPLLQRSCCQPAISRPGSDGSAATHGSSSEAGERIAPPFFCAAMLSAVQPANGSPSETLVSGPSWAAAAGVIPGPSTTTRAAAAVPTSAARSGRRARGYVSG